MQTTAPRSKNEESVSGGKFIEGKLTDGKLTLTNYSEASISQIHPIPRSYGSTDPNKKFTQVLDAERCKNLKNYIKQEYSAERKEFQNEIKGRIEDPSGKGVDTDAIAEWGGGEGVWFYVEVIMKVNGKDAIDRESPVHVQFFEKGLEIILSDLDKLTLVLAKSKYGWLGL